MSGSSARLARLPPKAIERAIGAARNSGQNPADHFAEVSKMITAGKGVRRKLKDYRLSRYACYLIIQNADPDKEIVALGQTYFAVQMRRQEVAETELLASLNDDQRRLYRVCTNENDLFTEKTVESGRLSEVVGPN